MRRLWLYNNITRHWQDVCCWWTWRLSRDPDKPAYFIRSGRITKDDVEWAEREIAKLAGRDRT